VFRKPTIGAIAAAAAATTFIINITTVFNMAGKTP